MYFDLNYVLKVQYSGHGLNYGNSNISLIQCSVFESPLYLNKQFGNLKKCVESFQNVIIFITCYLRLSCSSIQLFFGGKVIRQNRTNVTSFCIQFEKVGCGLLRETFWREGECFVSQKRGGGGRKDQSSIASVFTEFSRTDPFFFPPLYWLTKYSPSLQKAYLSNPRPTFSNCMKNNVTLMSFCLTTFCKKKQLYTTVTAVASLFHKNRM